MDQFEYFKLNKASWEIIYRTGGIFMVIVKKKKKVSLAVVKFNGLDASSILKPLNSLQFE